MALLQQVTLFAATSSLRFFDSLCPITLHHSSPSHGERLLSCLLPTPPVSNHRQLPRLCSLTQCSYHQAHFSRCQLDISTGTACRHLQCNGSKTKPVIFPNPAQLRCQCKCPKGPKCHCPSSGLLNTSLYCGKNLFYVSDSVLALHESILSAAS